MKTLEALFVDIEQKRRRSASKVLVSCRTSSQRFRIQFQPTSGEHDAGNAGSALCGLGFFPGRRLFRTTQAMFVTRFNQNPTRDNRHQFLSPLKPLQKPSSGIFQTLKPFFVWLFHGPTKPWSNQHDVQRISGSGV